MQTDAISRQSKSHIPLSGGLDSMAALWVGRVLTRAGDIQRFVRSSGGFREEGILILLGLGDLGDFELNAPEITELLHKRCREIEKQPLPKELPLTRNIHRLGDRLRLNEHERQVIAFMATYELYDELRDALEAVLPRYRGQLPRLIALVLDMRPVDVDRALARDGKLVRSGLIEKGRRFRLGKLDELDLLAGLAETLAGEFDHLDAIFENYFTESTPSQLSVEDYAHIRVDVERLKRLLAGSLTSRRQGVNVLLYGAPGVGKTELVKTLADSLNAHLFTVTSADQDGDSVTGEQRFQCLRLCQYMLADNNEALILFDEVEDVLSPGLQLFAPHRRIGKAWTNQQLETNTVPTFWLSNDVDGVDPAHLRRFDYVLKLTPPPRSTRERMLARACDGLPVSDQWIGRMAENESITPAQIEQAARLAELVGTCPGDTIETLMQDSLERQLSLQGKRLPQRRNADDWLSYSLNQVNTDEELAVLLEGLNHSGQGSLLLYGPPGTGKTAFAHHVSRHLDRPLIKRRASDLLGMYVGQTEKHIAAMFAEARREGAVLLLDEADSFLRKRELAGQSWEVTQINELLVQMEDFDGIFICATNFLKATDDASLRRFDMKIRFNYLTELQCWELLCNLLEQMGHPELEKEQALQAKQQLAALTTLTPGDFATLARRSKRLGLSMDLEQVLKSLADECAFKPGQARPIGFVY